MAKWGRSLPCQRTEPFRVKRCCPVRRVLLVFGLLAIGGVVAIISIDTGSPTTPMSFSAAVATSTVLSGMITFLAGRTYLRKNPRFRFGVPGTTFLLILLWAGIAFVFFDRLYNGY